MKKTKGRYTGLPVGTRFGKLVLLEETRGLPYPVKCRCDCGAIKIIRTLHEIVYAKKPEVKSCGCSKRRHGGAIGGKSSPEYTAWVSMRVRCAAQPGDPHYLGYAAKGIVVCDRWMNDFQAFLSDMGKKPSPLHSLDRIDNDGPYSPKNCRWATSKQQARNKGNNKWVEWNGVTKTIAEWAEITGHPHQRIYARLRMGWSVEHAMTVPVLPRAHPKKRYRAQQK